MKVECLDKDTNTSCKRCRRLGVERLTVALSHLLGQTKSETRLGMGLQLTTRRLRSLEGRMGDVHSMPQNIYPKVAGKSFSNTVKRFIERTLSKRCTIQGRRPAHFGSVGTIPSACNAPLRQFERPRLTTRTQAYPHSSRLYQSTYRCPRRGHHP